MVFSRMDYAYFGLDTAVLVAAALVAAVAGPGSVALGPWYIDGRNAVGRRLAVVPRLPGLVGWDSSSLVVELVANCMALSVVGSAGDDGNDVAVACLLVVA